VADWLTELSEKWKAKSIQNTPMYIRVAKRDLSNEKEKISKNEKLEK
jgi:hypothetical protein